MTQEEKLLFLQDLCSRLPYGVKIWYKYFESAFVPFATSIRLAEEKISLSRFLNKEGDWFPIIEADEILIKPYLRPMPSMTREELKEFSYTILQQPDLDAVRNWQTISIDLKELPKVLGWLNKKMFDYCGLIPMGLALEATKEMYCN